MREDWNRDVTTNQKATTWYNNEHPMRLPEIQAMPTIMQVQQQLRTRAGKLVIDITRILTTLAIQCDHMK